MAEKPTIAERQWCQFAVDYMEQALDATKKMASDLDNMLTCDSCLRLFDKTDPRAHHEQTEGKTFLGEPITSTMGWCPGCNIESDPALAVEALEKAADMNPKLMPADARSRIDAAIKSTKRDAGVAA